MATRRPLVSVGGSLAELPVGDVLQGSRVFSNPASPTIIAPANGTSYAGTFVTVSGYTHPEDVPHFCTQIQRATNAGMTEGLETTPISANQSLSVFLPYGSYGQTYYVRARVLDWFGGASEWSSITSYVCTTPIAFVGAAQDGTGNQNSRSLSIAASRPGDLYIQSVAYQGASPAPVGFTKIYDQNSYLDGTTHAVYTKSVSIAGEVAEISAYARVLVCLRGIGSLSSTPFLNFMDGGTASKPLVLPTGGTGAEGLVLGWDRSTSPNTIAAPWSQYFGDVGGGVNGYWTPVIAFSSVSEDARIWSRSSNQLSARALTYKLR